MAINTENKRRAALGTVLGMIGLKLSAPVPDGDISSEFDRRVIAGTYPIGPGEEVEDTVRHDHLTLLGVV